MKKYEYTYKIKNINIENATIIVEYTTSDLSLTSYTLNVPTYILNEDGTRKSIDEVIKMCAPHERWESQEILVDQYNEILNKTELVLIENA